MGTRTGTRSPEQGLSKTAIRVFKPQNEHGNRLMLIPNETLGPDVSGIVPSIDPEYYHVTSSDGFFDEVIGKAKMTQAKASSNLSDGNSTGIVVRKTSNGKGNRKTKFTTAVDESDDSRCRINSASWVLLERVFCRLLEAIMVPQSRINMNIEERLCIPLSLCSASPQKTSLSTFVLP